MILRLFSVLIMPLLFLSCSDATLDQKMSHAEEYTGIGKISEALKLYEQVSKACPEYDKCAEALLIMGDLQGYAENEPLKALDTYAKITRYFPLLEAGRVALERRAKLYEHIGDYLGAADEYASLIQHFPQSEDAPKYLLRLGESYLAMGNYKQARMELTGFVESDKVDPMLRQEALFAYAETYFLEDRLGLAEKAYRKLIEEYPESELVPEATMKIATCQEERGFLGYAAETLRDARKDYPNRDALDERLNAMRNRGKVKPPEFREREKKQN